MNMRRGSVGPKMTFYTGWDTFIAEEAKVQADPATMRTAAPEDVAELAMCQLAKKLLHQPIAGNA